MESKVIDKTLCFIFSERLDTLAAMSLQKEITDTIAAHDPSLAVMFDFAGVDYISSGFIRTIMTVVRMKGKNFSIININPAVRQILKIANLDKLIAID
ncbi:MAG: STAS domain-containing protein [Syntrophales bacterium]|nr:STAS domain-containing protein [Syntrophales bacterium]